MLYRHEMSREYKTMWECCCASKSSCLAVALVLWKAILWCCEYSYVQYVCATMYVCSSRLVSYSQFRRSRACMLASGWSGSLFNRFSVLTDTALLARCYTCYQWTQVLSTWTFKMSHIFNVNCRNCFNWRGTYNVNVCCMYHSLFSTVGTKQDPKYFGLCSMYQHPV
jgi:hypothetical protein